MSTRTASAIGRRAGKLSQPAPAGRCAGSTLIEVLVALGILATCTTFFAQMLLRGIDESRQARERARAAMLAQDIMEEILAHRDNLAAWETRLAESYDFDKALGLYRYRPEDLRRFYWKWELRRPEKHPDMKEALVQVRWKAPGRRTLATRCELRMLLAGGPKEATP